jgi:hypothetical protein
MRSQNPPTKARWFVLVFVLFPGLLAAQSFELGKVYQCAAGAAFKVTSCTGPNASDLCDVQSTLNGQNQAGKSTRQQILALVPLCHLQTPAEATAAAPGGAPNAQAPTAQAGVGGFKVGDTVQVDTAFGWADAKVVRFNGPNYYVRVQGIEVMKTYPKELRRIGPTTAEDRANGLYAMHDRVQVNVEGRWTDGEVITERALEFQVQIPGNRTVWASGQNIRLVTPADKVPSSNPKAGTPPKPGMTSCAGKIEGRYSSSSGFGMLSITFQSGKATIAGGLGGADEEFECWTGGGKIILHKAGQSNATDIPIDINSDGTLDTPMGEIRKKGN